MTKRSKQSAIANLKNHLSCQGIDTFQLEEDLKKGIDWVIENKNPGNYSPKAKAVGDIYWEGWAD